MFLLFSHTFTFQILDKPWSQASSLLPPVSCINFSIAHMVQQSHCSPIFHRVLLTYALALSASQFVHKKKSQRTYTSMHSAGLELTKLTYTRLEDNLIRHRGNRHVQQPNSHFTWRAFESLANRSYTDNMYKVLVHMMLQPHVLSVEK